MRYDMSIEQTQRNTFFCCNKVMDGGSTAGEFRDLLFAHRLRSPVRRESVHIPPPSLSPLFGGTVHQFNRPSLLERG